MKTKIREWLLAEYASVGVDGLRIDTVMNVLADTLNEIHDKDMFDKRISMSKNLSVLLYRSGTVEIHINIEGKLSTYESWENPNYIVKVTGTETTILGHLL